MNYPIWELDTVGGGSLIALIAVLHTYIAQFAVGGGIFLFVTDWLAQKNGDQEMVEWVRKHTKFFLLLTMVFGGVTGVGIWFVIGLVQPAATSELIHAFVFGWATEWVFFIIEIVALLVYHYRFSKMDGQTRIKVAFVYAVAAWASLFIINGILSFMLTPGDWLETRDFWDGFFNPTFWPSLVYRTFTALLLAGLFGFLTATWIKRDAFRMRVMRYNLLWLAVPVSGLVLSAIWYFLSLPEHVQATTFEANPEAVPFMKMLFLGGAAAVVGGFLLVFRAPRGVQRVVALAVLLLGLVWHNGFEYVREIARKPYVISGYMYSTSIHEDALASLDETGVLAQAKWVQHKEVTPENRLEAGRDLFNIQCLACHTNGGWYNDIRDKTETLTHAGARAMLAGLGKVHDYMPPFVGTDAERDALAAFLVHQHGKPLDKPVDGPMVAQRPADPPERVDAEATHVLLAWNDLGMHCISDSAPWFLILPPANSIEAQLVERDDVPALVAEDVEITYEVLDENHANPSAHVRFWDYTEQLLGKKIPPNIGVKGAGMSGELHPQEGAESWAVHGIPVVPYRDDGKFDPYPVFKVTAKDEDGEVLAETHVVTPTSTEMRCLGCHDGEWGKGTSGVGDDTAANILKLHDRDNGTHLYEDALAGKPAMCQSCHADPAVGSKGEPGVLSLSAALHGWHANYMDLQGADSCKACHPAADTGPTRCSRGVHDQLGLSCTDCHGSLDEHAATLLVRERHKPSAEKLLTNLKLDQVASIEDIAGRTPWLNEPDCLNCHNGFYAPRKKQLGTDAAGEPVMGYSSFNQWTGGAKDLYRNRTDSAGLKCAACHGSPHALYPAKNPIEQHRDNHQPLQLSGMPYPVGSNESCLVCHTEMPEGSMHHANMRRPFRNKQLWNGPQEMVIEGDDDADDDSEGAADDNATEPAPAPAPEGDE